MNNLHYIYDVLPADFLEERRDIDWGSLNNENVDQYFFPDQHAVREAFIERPVGMVPYPNPPLRQESVGMMPNQPATSGPIGMMESPPLRQKPAGSSGPVVSKKTPKSRKPLKQLPTGSHYIDTTKLCREIAAELNKAGIPQTVFAKNVLGRTQGTFSDVLKKPKPWDAMKPSGRQIYIKMYEWLGLSPSERIAMLDMESSESSKPATPKPTKKRFSYTSVQKKTLAAIFKEEKRPNERIKTAIAEQLNLDIGQVNTYFLNARRRSRFDKINDVDMKEEEEPNMEDMEDEEENSDFE